MTSILFYLLEPQNTLMKRLDKQSLIQDIEKYKTIKQCLSHLEAQKRDLEKEISIIKKET
ncbi:MAG: hypothetical protein ACE5SW_02270 [Nitrososphaeraceae archaeon]